MIGSMWLWLMLWLKGCTAGPWVLLSAPKQPNDGQASQVEDRLYNEMKQLLYPPLISQLVLSTMMDAKNQKLLMSTLFFEQKNVLIYSAEKVKQ